jgi:hypothetical protein
MKKANEMRSLFGHGNSIRNPVPQCSAETKLQLAEVAPYTNDLGFYPLLLL